MMSKGTNRGRGVILFMTPPSAAAYASRCSGVKIIRCPAVRRNVQGGEPGTRAGLCRGVIALRRHSVSLEKFTDHPNGTCVEGSGSWGRLRPLRQVIGDYISHRRGDWIRRLTTAVRAVVRTRPGARGRDGPCRGVAL